jgi:hypothetical protein
MRRPRNGYHYPSPDLSWDDAGPNHVPMMQVVSVNEPERGEVVAKLWVPDIEMRHGWREIWVRRDVDPPEERRAGFR